MIYDTYRLLDIYDTYREIYPIVNYGYLILRNIYCIYTKTYFFHTVDTMYIKSHPSQFLCHPFLAFSAQR